MTDYHSFFQDASDIEPQFLSSNMSVPNLIEKMGKTSFEARNLYRGCTLFRRMIDEGDTIWLGIAGAGIVGGMGGMVISLLEAGFVDVICSTGAQVYHDLHFAFDLPVKAVQANQDDNALRKHGDVRIYDIGIREKETLEAQDEIIRQFIQDEHTILFQEPLSSMQFNYQLGLWVGKNAPFPEKSFTATAARLGVPLFWDSLTNHSIAMNLVRSEREGYPVQLSAQKDILESSALVYDAEQTAYILLGGGGPKNFIQQTGPTLHQILDVDYDGADRGIQIGTAVEREGSLSSCTFNEAVTWGKYQSAHDEKLVQIWAEYSLVFPLLSAFVLDLCEQKPSRNLISFMSDIMENLESRL